GITFVDVLEEGRALLFVERFVVGARQAVDEADRGKSEVRSPNYEVQSVRQSKFLIRHFPRAGDAELADQQEIVVHRFFNDPPSTGVPTTRGECVRLQVGRGML